MHQLEDAEFYHPTKIEIISGIGDALCRKLGGHPFARADRGKSCRANASYPGRQKAQRALSKIAECPFARKSPREPPGSRMGQLPGAIVTLFRLRDYDGNFIRAIA